LFDLACCIYVGRLHSQRRRASRFPAKLIDERSSDPTIHHRHHIFSWYSLVVGHDIVDVDDEAKYV
jgi:hypothetical protein